MTSFIVVILLTLQCFNLFDKTQGHGMLLNPAGRSSRWRIDSSALANYNDMSYYCGGLSVHYNVNGGKCGLCGDDFSSPAPRDNELGGKYGGSGVIVQTYENTQTINVKFNLTMNHLGYVYFEVCNLANFDNKESEECFAENRLKFADGTDKFDVGRLIGAFSADVVLPSSLNCDHCVMRWTYRAGNNWGMCGNGDGALGCGNQETFKSCADISIRNSK